MTSLTRAPLALTLALLAAGWPVVVPAQPGKTVKVSLDAQQSGTQSREGVRGSGRVVITERGGTRPSGKVGEQHRIAALEQKLQRMNHVLAVLMEEYVALMENAAEVRT